MNVLAVNCGSSTLKFKFLEVEPAGGGQRERKIAEGAVSRIGEGEAAVTFSTETGEGPEEHHDIADHEEAARHVLGRLGASLGSHRIEAVGHRVVHGGDRFVEPTLLDGEAQAAIESLIELAPLHNAPALAAIRAVGAVLGPSVPMAATFDTAFHRTLPERASRYAIPLDLADRHRIRRYGFHGLAHRSMTERYREISGERAHATRLITLQLGNGCSATAVHGGRSIDTSMGFTPLEGLMMGTRSGDVDPSLVGFLTRTERASVDEVEDWLNTRSGLLGVSGRSRDVRELLGAERAGDERAVLALDMFCYRVRKCIGAYVAALAGADAIVFGGGIGEHAPELRARICTDMAWCGLTIDEERNQRAAGSEGRISTDRSTLHAYVIAVDEELIIARDTLRCLLARR